MKVLYQAADRVEAQLLKDYLASYHIKTLVQGEYLTGAAGELPPMIFPVLWVVEDDDYTRGLQLIQHFLNSEDRNPPWICIGCDERNEGEFHICWNCARPKQ